MRNRYPQWDEQIIELYTLGYSIRQIAQEVRWSPGFVRNRLIFNGVELRGRGGNKRPLTNGAAILAAENMYLRGFTIEEIAKEHGVAHSTIIRRLDKAGVKRRPPGGGSHKPKLKSG